MINVVTTTIVALAVLGDIENGVGHHHKNRTLMTVHPVTVIDHAVHAVTEAALGPITAPDPAPLWRAEVRTMMRLKVVHSVTAVPVSSKGADMVGQGL